VACGEPPVKIFSFHELIYVFEAELWVFILAFVVIVAVFIAVVDVPVDMTFSLCFKKVWTLEKIVSIFIQVTKVLLEQGDPFTSKVAVQARLRFSIGTFLLVGIVLSNAYKSSNVYNLVLPREPVPYENLSQLFADKFDTYSRGQIIGLEDWKGINFNLWPFDSHRAGNYNASLKITTLN